MSVLLQQFLRQRRSFKGQLTSPIQDQYFYSFIRRISTSISKANRSRSVIELTTPTCNSSVDRTNPPLTFSSGKHALLADGSVFVKCGNTTIMVTAVSSRSPLSSSQGVPLTVDYRERASAVGKIPHNFLRRELRPSDREIVTSRFIDRSIRPLFPFGYSCNTQVIGNLLAVDGINDPDVMSINGASAALSLSDIPWNGPVAAVRVGLLDGKFIINPTTKEAKQCTLSLLLSCTEDKIVMLEGHGSEISERVFCDAVKFGLSEAQPILATIKTLSEYRHKGVREVPLVPSLPEIQELVENYCRDDIMTVLRDASHKKLSRDDQLFSIRDKVKEHTKELEEKGTFPSSSREYVEQSFWTSVKHCMNHLVMNDKIRCDGRGLTDLRPIQCEVDLFEPLHGSSLFLRGETQVLSSVTFDSMESAAKADSISSVIGVQKSRNFMLHYEFPPFATNVIGPFMLAGRREIGHGMLAEKALIPLLPNDFPFAIRVSSQVTDSNGSSSMATVCGASLALHDAGVALQRPVAGVACGLMLGGNDEYAILSDLSGIEDALGHMDFKIAGTREGMTSFQVDIKDCDGLSYDLIEETVSLSLESRHKVLDIMDSCQSSPRPVLKDNTPVYENYEVPITKRHKLIGVGGYKIGALIEETGAEIATISDELISIFAPNRSVMNEVLDKIEALLNEPDIDEYPLEIGAVYNSRVIDIKPFGLLVELQPSKQKALIHISQLDHREVSHPEELGMQLGQEVCVKYFGRNPAGRIQVSRKALLKNPFRRAKVDSQVADSDTSVEDAILEHAKTLSNEKKKKS